MSRLLGGGPDAPDRKDENVLVISDIHLGEDVLHEGPEHLSGYIRLLNKELAGFVRAHTDRIVDERSWHLVIDGDMVDFIKVSVRADDETQVPAAHDVVFKLTRILEIHRPLFREIARFLLRGHRITIVEGNHDAEFYFGDVQSTLRDFVIGEAEKAHRREALSGELDAEGISHRLQFRPWFEANGGRYHIEHGHQYDEYCSFEYHLAPIDRADGKHQRIAHPMSHQLIPHFVDILGDFSTHGADKWSFSDYLRFVFAKGPQMTWVLFRVYFSVVINLLRQAGRQRSVTLRDHAPSHREQLEAHTRTSPYGLDVLTRLDALKARPAEYSVLKMMRLFYFDRFLLGAATLLVLIGAACVGNTKGWVVAAVTSALATLAWWRSNRTRVVNVEEKLRRAAAAIADVTGARYVVFGHSHHPELVDLRARYGGGRFGEGAYYINSGSWVTRELMRGEAGQGMSYVEITTQGAALKRWHGDEREPDVMAATPNPV